MKELAFLLILFTVFNCTEDITDPDKSSCVDSTKTLASATANFNSVTPENYELQCNAYKEALQNQKDSCGDESGEIQKIIDTLGDCSLI